MEEAAVESLEKLDLADFGNLLRSDPVTLDDQELLALDHILHSAWKVKRNGGRVTFGKRTRSFDDMIKLHVSIKKEMAERRFKHILLDELDDQTERAIREQELKEAIKDDFAKQAEGPKLANQRAKLRPANPKNSGERCGFCTFFSKPSGCKIVEGPVAANLVCDWIQSRNVDAPMYSVADEDWIAFGKGMIERQPYQHIVRDVAITPQGPLVMIEDTAKPSHKFSLTKAFHIEHTSLEHHWTQEEADELVRVGNEEDESSKMFAKRLRPAFGSPGGKRWLSLRIVDRIPKHRVYVEPFIGGGAVFFAKELSEREIINDKDADIAFAYKFIKGLDEDKVRRLKMRKTTFDREHFFRMVKSKPTDNLERFYKFIYTNAFSYGRTRTGTTLTQEGMGIGDIAPRFDRYFERIKPRLKNVDIFSQDFEGIIDRFNEPDAFFYLDPPYANQMNRALGDHPSLEQMEQAVGRIKGKFMLSLADTKDARDLFKKYHLVSASVRRTMTQASPHTDQELFIANFPLTTGSPYLAKYLDNPIFGEEEGIEKEVTASSPISEKADHLGIPVGADGKCPASYPIKRGNRCFRKSGPGDTVDSEVTDQTTPSTSKTSNDSEPVPGDGKIVGIVIEKLETRSRGIFNYVFGIDPQKTKIPQDTVRSVGGKTYHVVGKTFQTPLDLEPGDLVLVKFKTLAQAKDDNFGETKIAILGSSIVGLSDKKKASTIGEAIRDATKKCIFDPKSASAV